MLDSPADATAATTPRAAGPPVTLALALAVIVGLAVGAFTAYGQGWLGDSVSSIVNSAGPWSVAAFLVARTGRRLAVAVPAAVITLVCCEVGYVIANELRDVPSATSTVVFWITAGLLAGPPLGIAASWTHEDDVRRPLGWGVLAGVLVGEAIYGWTMIADTTEWRYWAAELLVGLLVAAAVAAVEVRRRHAAGALAVLGATAASAAVVYGAGRLG